MGLRQSLLPLVGFSWEEIIQVHCHHKEGAQGQRYQLDKCQVFDSGLDKKEAMRIGDVIPGGASFEVFWGPLRLQIRVKPMNVFTVPGLKMNCPVKYGVESHVH